MEKRLISVNIILLLLGFMLGAYSASPWYSAVIKSENGYVILDSDLLYKSVSDKEVLCVYISENIYSKSVEKVLPKIFPVEKGTKLKYPLGATSEKEKVQFLALNVEEEKLWILEECPSFIVSREKEPEEKEVLEDAESPCFEIGEDTRCLAEHLWEQSGNDEKKYVDSVFRYLSNMEYDWEFANTTFDEDVFRYCMRMNLDDVLKKEKAICREKANLMAALLRLKAIPCKVVVGKFEEGDKYGHAWNEVYICDKWILFDATNSMMGPSAEERMDETRFISYWYY